MNINQLQLNQTEMMISQDDKEQKQQIIEQIKMYDIRKVINQYFQQTLLKINQQNKQKSEDLKLPYFEYKINEEMNQNELKQIAKTAFTLLKIQTNLEEVEIIRKQSKIQIFTRNCMIRFSLNNSLFEFGEWQLNKKNKKTMNGLGLVIATGKRMQAGDFKHDRLNGKGKYCSASGNTNELKLKFYIVKIHIIQQVIHKNDNKLCQNLILQYNILNKNCKNNFGLLTNSQVNSINTKLIIQMV